MSAVDRIATDLRERILDSTEGLCLGSEEGLGQQFGVSKPTLRQAARVLQNEGLLEVRRGAQGGYFTRRPRLEFISRMAATYFRSTTGSIDAIDPVMEAIRPVTIQAVLRSGRTHLFAEFSVERTSSAPVTVEELIDSESRFMRLLMDLTGNPAIQLIHSIVYQVGSNMPKEIDPALLVKPKILDIRVALAKALMARDAEAAIALYTQYSGRISQGIRGSLRPAAPRKRKPPR